MAHASPFRCRRLPLVTLACALLAAAPACLRGWPRTIEGDGRPTTQVREVGGGFDAVDTRGALDVEVKVGPAASVAVTIDGNLQPYVDVRVEGSTLVVDQRESLRWRGRAHVGVTLPSLRAVSTSGSGAATIDGGPGSALALSSSGSGALRWHGEVARLEVSTSGSGGAVLDGRAAALRVSTNGSGSVAAGALTVSDDAEVTTSGSGSVELAVRGAALRARTNGSGEVVYAGEARSVEAHVNGSGSVRRR